MGMLDDKSNVGFVLRSWRYVMVVNDGLIEKNLHRARLRRPMSS
jgi:peroxiredoxin